MAIARTQLLKELLPGLNALFGLEYEKYEDEHTMIYETESSDRSFEEEVKLSGFGSAPVKPEGEAIAFDTAQESFTARYNHETVAMGFSITEEAMEDNLYDSLSARYTKALARGMAYTKQTKAVTPLNNGFTSFQSGDGVTLFNTAHPTVAGGSNRNRPTTAADLNETTLEPALTFVATRVLQSDLRVGTADNDINAIRTNGSIPEGYEVNHYLTDTNAFFIITDVPNGMKHFERTPMQTSMDGDFDTGNVRYKARERYSFGVSDPLGIYGSPGST